jgi:digeranylgeranylglycerophospholipid reductase
MQKPIAIIGGGPGGLSAAIRALELGLKVVIYEKGQVGGGIKCAEGFIDTLGILGKPEAGILFKVKKVIFEADKAYPANFSGDYGIWMMNRSTWQRALAERARDLGASIEEDYPIDKRRLRELQETHRYVIDASGAPSVSSRLYGFVSTYLENAMLLVQYSVEGDFSFLGKNTIKIVYESQNMGFYWIFPKGRNKANVGVGRFHLNQKKGDLRLKEKLDDVLIKEGLDGYMIQKKVSGFTPSSSVARLVWGNTILVGDAAALCSPLHGGGIDMACISGRLAAELIASNQISQYPTGLWGIIGKKLTMERRVRCLWHFFGYPFICGILKYPGLMRRIFFNEPPIPQIIGFGGKNVF